METDSLEESDENKTDLQVSKATDIIVKEKTSFTKQLENLGHVKEVKEKQFALQLKECHSDDELLSIYQIKFKAAIKRNKDLNLLVQKQKTQIKSLLGEIGTLTAQINSTTPLDEEKDELLKVILLKEKQIIKLKDEVSSLKLQVNALKKTTKKLENIIKKEVGNDFKLSDSDREDSWRGRAQTISLLTDKLSSLKDELKDLKGEPQTASNASINAQAQASIQLMEKDLKESKLELIEKQKSIENKLITSLEKNKSLKARNTSIEYDLKRSKEQVDSLKRTNDNDHVLIESLNRDLSIYKSQVSALRDQARGFISELDFSKVLEENRKLQTQLASRDDEFALLQVSYDDLKEKYVSLQSSDVDEVVHQVNLKLTHVENERLNEMLDLFKRKFEEQTAQNQSLQYRLQVMDGKLYDSQKLSGKIVNKPRRMTSLNEVQDLKSKLKQTVYDLKKTKFNSSEQLAVKTEEVRILRAMNEEMRRAYEDAIMQMKEEIRLKVFNHSFSNDHVRKARKKARNHDALRLPNIKNVRSPSTYSKYSYSNIHGGRSENCFLTNPHN